MSDRARFLMRRNDEDLAEWTQRLGQSMQALGMHAIVIGDEDFSHLNARSCRSPAHMARQAQANELGGVAEARPRPPPGKLLSLTSTRARAIGQIASVVM